jgi:hypothetical protein
MPKNQFPATVDQIEPLILMIRGQRVILDADLARLYGTRTKALNQAVRRNPDRFPEDFALRLNAAEKNEVVTNCDHLRRLKFSPARPLAFTEHGTIMAANVLNSPRAVHMSVLVVRTFIRLRIWLAAHKELADRLNELERRVSAHDEFIRSLVSAIRQLMAPPPEKARGRIGFGRQED